MMGPPAAKNLTPGPPDTASTLTPGHTTTGDADDGDYALASKYYNTEIQATKCAHNARMRLIESSAHDRTSTSSSP